MKVKSSSEDLPEPSTTIFGIGCTAIKNVAAIPAKVNVSTIDVGFLYIILILQEKISRLPHCF